MTNPSESRSSRASRRQDDEVIWGLGPDALHDGWWAGQGVQCVRRGEPISDAVGVELYMLMDPGQLVAFRLSEVAEAMVWNTARLVRVRLVERSEENYKEQIVRDETGTVEGIRRSYKSDEQVRFSFLLTTDFRLAQCWANSKKDKQGWIAGRKSDSGRVSHERAVGHCFDAGLPEGRREFLAWLVASWDSPSRVFPEVVSLRPGVFAENGVEIREDDVLIPPVWLGRGQRESGPRVMVGPAFQGDSLSKRDESSPIRQRPIRDIMPPRGRDGQSLLPRGSLYGLAKRGFDIFVSAFVLLLASPVLLLIAFFVVIDDGFPVFFGHVRQKRGGEEFRCWKFRTMRRNAESLVEKLRELNKADGPQVFIENDPRVTRVGRTLRKLQLDELPQFWNVLLGQMSIVGPRPSPDRENQFCPAWREMRLSVRPGITGLWQVQRTREPGLDFQEWIRYDIEYVRTASFGLDLKICLLTARSVIFSRG